MVQSIWLNFDRRQMTKKNIQTIIETVKDTYKTYSYIDTNHSNTHKFVFLDYTDFKVISRILGIKLDDKKRCSCGCCSTTLEIVMYFCDLEFNYGKIFLKLVKDKSVIQPTYFNIGRNVWGDVGQYYERLNILRFILEEIKSNLDDKGIKSKLDIDDCEKETFVDYFNKEDDGK